MKRKSFLILSALMALWSCSNDDALEGVAIEGNEVIKVAIAAQLPPNSAVGTYATPLNAGSNNSGIDNVDPDLYALRYQLEIRDVTDGNKVVYKEMKVQDIAASPQKTDFTADLIKGKEYRFVLWADITLKSENGGQDDHFYKTSDATMGLSAIELDATKFTVNDEAKDAYFVSDLKTVSGAAIDLTLHRPLGKIRFISTDFKSLNDTDQAKVIDNSAAKYYSATAKVYTKFNAVTGDVDVNSILVQATKATPAVGKSVKNSDGTLTMFWDYTFAPKDVQTYLNFQVDYTLTEKIPRYFFDTKIVIERNKLTTVRSTLFTQNQAINVTIDDDFIDGLTPGDTKIHIGQNPYNSIADAMSAAVSGDVIELLEGVYAEDVTLKAGVSLKGAGKLSVITGYIQVAGNSTLKDFTSSYMGKKISGGTATRTALAVTGKNVTVDNVIFKTATGHSFTGGSKPEAIVVSTEGFVFKNSVISEPYWKGMYLQTSKDVQILNNHFNNINPFSTDLFDASMVVTGNEFIRKGFYDTRMPHITAPTALKGDVANWPVGLETLVGQIKESNTWTESGSSIGLGASLGHYSKAVKINSYYVGQAGATSTSWIFK